jgi:hypothetical protein
MKRREISALDLLEESTHLLRALPLSAVAHDFIGTLPFVLGLLFFWYEMVHGAFAAEHAGLASLGLALLFIWMNVWQSLFAASVRQALDGNAGPPRIGRLLILQSIVQPSGLLALPVAAIITLPFAAAFAFYQNLNCMEPEDNLRDTCRKALRAAATAPKQSWILLALLSLLGLILFVNLGVGIFILAKLVNSFLGVESTFTRNPAAIFNSTFLAIVAGLTYLVLDPLVKTAYTLRCFYAASRTSGADLRAALKRLSPAAALLLLLLAPVPSHAQTAISTQRLDNAIDQVIHRPLYSWRLPRRNAAPQSETALERLARSIVEGLSQSFRALSRWYQSAEEWIRDFFRKKQLPETSGGGAPAGAVLRFAAIGICCVLAGMASVMVWRLWRQGADKSPAVESQGVASPVNIDDDNLTAEQLPEEEWLRLGRDLLAQGDYRKGARAFYLAALANLGRRELIRLAKSKTNREYEKELGRRARGVPHVIPAFAESARIYERTWYGDHLADALTLEQLTASLERIRADA